MGHTTVENNRAKTLWDFKFQTDKQLYNQLVAVGKEQSGAVVIESQVTVTSGRGSTRKSKLEQMWKVESKVV